MRVLVGLYSCCAACCALQTGASPPTTWTRAVKKAAAASVAALTLTFGDTTTLPSGFHPPAAAALTEEQEVINEAWRVVNLAFVDKSFSGKDWKAERLKAVKGEYKTRDSAYAAAKSMIQVLGDPFTRFLTPNEVCMLLQIRYRAALLLVLL
jgi:C-terminal processing protease CtpA/Prc